MDPMQDSGTADQITMVWNAMLTQATAGGMTRDQISLMTLDTARAVVKATAGALWPSGDTRDVPPGERVMYAEFAGVEDYVDQAMKAIREAEVDSTAEEEAPELPPAA